MSGNGYYSDDGRRGFNRDAYDGRWKDFAYSVQAVSEQERASIMHSEGFQTSPVKKVLLACLPPAIVIAAALLAPLPLSQAENTVQNQPGQTAAGTAEVEKQAASMNQDIVAVEEPARQRADEVRSLWFDQSSFGDAKYQEPYSIAEYGGGLCATTAALDIVLGQDWTPVQAAETMSRWAAENGNVKYCIDKGTVYAVWKKVIEGAYDVRISALNSADDIAAAVASGNPVVACGEGKVFKSADGTKYAHDGRIICFYRIEGENVMAKDSDHVYGGADIAYSKDELEAFAVSGKNKIFEVAKV